MNTEKPTIDADFVTVTNLCATLSGFPGGWTVGLAINWDGSVVVVGVKNREARRLGATPEAFLRFGETRHLRVVERFASPAKVLETVQVLRASLEFLPAP